MNAPRLSSILERAIATRLRLPVLAFGLLLGCLLALAQYRSVAREGQELGAALGRHVEQHLAHAESALQALALLASRDGAGDSLHALQQGVSLFLDGLEGFERVVRLDARGGVVAAVPAQGLVLPEPGREVVMTGRSRVVSRPRPSPVSGDMVVEVECSIPGGGAMVGAFSLQRLGQSMRGLLWDEDDRLLLADQDGAVLLYAVTPADSVNAVSANATGPWNIAPWPAFQRAADGQGSVMLQRVEGRLSLTVSQKLPRTGWVMLVSRPLAPMLWSTLLALGAYLASAALLYLVLRLVIHQEIARQVTAPLQQFAGSLRGLGNAPAASQAALLGQGPWAIAELVGLAEAFGRMVNQVLEREDALRASEARYRTIYENAIEGIFQVNPQGVILHCNPALARMFGYDNEDDVRRSVPNIAMAYADMEHRPGVLELLYSEGQIMGLELPMLRKDGSTIWVMVNAVAVYDETGGLGCIEGMLTDITPRKRTEEELATSQEFFRAVFEGIHDGLMVQDADEGAILDVNRRACEMYGYSYEEMLGLQIQRISLGEPPYSVREVEENLQRAREQGGHAFEWLSRRKDGELFWTDVTLSPVVVGGAARIIASVRDISERKRIELARQEAETRYRALVQNAPVGIFSSAVDGRLLGANPENARILGYDSVEELLQHVRDMARDVYVQPQDRAALLEHLFRHGSVHAYEVQFRRKDGSAFWCSVTARLVRDERGAPKYIEGFQMDVTERKAAETAAAHARGVLEQQVAERTKELRQANARLLELDRLKTSFLSSASHELRTPLTSILGFAKLTGKMFRRHFLAGEDLPPPVRQHGDRIAGNLDIIAKEGVRLSRLVNDLLDINAIESGMMAWRDSDVPLAEVLEEAVASARGMLPASGRVRLETLVAEGLPTLRVDRDKLLQVLQNLLNNAVKFTSSGVIQVLARVLPGAAVDPGSDTEACGDMVEIRVEDTGQGIPAASLETVFQKFYQILPEGRDEDKPRGTGLGLAICKEIVEHYGGRIWAESTLGAGATFVLHLPLQRATICPLGGTGQPPLK